MKAMKKYLIAAAVVVSCAFTVWAQTPQKKAYFLVQSDVTNPTQYAEYAKLTPAIVEKFGGKFLTRGGQSSTLEGRQAPARVVVIEFPSYERAQAFYNSPEYQKARKVRDGAATLQVVLVEGL
jgi:uncharacterized protein (DUF1330 family)